MKLRANTESALFVLRKWRPTDDLTLSAHANHYRVWKFLKDSFPYPYTPEHAREWLKVANRSPQEEHFAIEVEGQAVGGIGITLQQDVYRHNAEIGYWLGPDYWGRGIMSAAVDQMVNYVFENHDVYRIYGRVFQGNGASVRVLEKAGFVKEAVLRKSVIKEGVLLDEYIYARLR